ncbi:prolyl oligopeptidase family serine peptidase [Piscinibacterium candidicorallinum]|uniref:Prolyl oligopeptidase family serine peptidase n=1 Tax=Piscinibacterium candidicorallinum TaxID=1793872 RepID=A0ABV7HBC8_9BURK
MTLRRAALTLALATAGTLPVLAQTAATPAAPATPATSAAAVIAPNANLRAEGIPPIQRTIAERVAAYTDFRGYGFMGWHPKNRSMLVRHRGATDNLPQVYLLDGPNGTMTKLTDFAESVQGASFEPKEGRYLVYARDTGGNEATKIYRMDLPSRESTLLSNPDERSSAMWTEKGDRILISAVPLDRTAQGGTRAQVTTTLTFVNPLKPEEKTRLAELPGGGWFGGRFSPDDSRLALVQYRTNSDTELFLLDTKTGQRERILPAAGQPAAGYFPAAWSKDGKRLFLTTNAGSEFNELAVYDLSTKTLTSLTRHIPWDVSGVDLSKDGKLLIAEINNNGRDEMRLFDATTGKELPAPKVPAGAIGGTSWHESLRDEVAFSLNSPQSPGDAYSLNVKTGAVTRWTTAYAPPTIDPNTFVTPQLIQWKSFDGRMISGWLFAPDAKKFPGKRPVFVDFHGGPEAQSTVRFMGRWNYYINEMGIAVILPNVRGSTGYGKSFAQLDNGFLREDSVKDGGALLDWLATQPNLDSKRVVVSGGSYGGYMSLAMATHYSERLRGAIDIVGISHFVTFLNNTESYRRDLRRVEYGDERDPKMREFQEKIAPLNNAHRIKVPLFVIHGKNDPRVPYTEAEQIVQKVRANNVPVWYLLADNEGHGFARRVNADFQFYATVKFLETYLLN